MKAKQILATEKPVTLYETPNSALVKGNWTFGMVTARHAMNLAIKKAKNSNISIVGGVQVMHIGRLGEYAEMAAAEKMISTIWSGGYAEVKEYPPSAVPYGGKKAILQANPFSMGFPAGDEPPMISDFATTVNSNTKLHFLREKKQELPPGSCVDKNGNPTCNPEDFFNGGAHLPFGGHKGYAILLANEFLGRIFTGADLFAKDQGNHTALLHSGFTMIVFKSDIFITYKEYSSKVDELENRIRAVPPAPGFKEVLIPGDLERRTRQERTKNGIPIADKTWEAVIEIAKSLNLQDIL